MDFNYINKLASTNEGIDIEFKRTTGQLNRGTNDSWIIEKTYFCKL